MQISIEEIMSFGPCDAWPRERILEVTGGREEFDTAELALFEVPTEDLIWLTTKILESVGNRDEYMIAAAFAELVLPLYECDYPDDPRPRHAIRAARLYAMCEIKKSELSAARAAASAASAVWDAVWAARAAVLAASYAWDAVWAARAACDAACDAELKAQREICATFLVNMKWNTNTPPTRG